MKNWLEYVEDSAVRYSNGSVSFTVRACKWLNAGRIDRIIEALLESAGGWSVQILPSEAGLYRIYLDKKYSALTVDELNDFISKKLWPYYESHAVSDETFDLAFAKQEKAKPDGTGHTVDFAYNGFWTGLVRVNGEIDEHDFLVVSVLSRSVLEAALGALHRSYRAVKAMPEITEVAMPSKLSLENTNFHSPYAAAYAIRRDNAWIGAERMIRRLNDLITSGKSVNFAVSYNRRLQDRGGSNGQVWYRSDEAAKFFMELNVEPVAPKQERPKAAGKPRKWIEFLKPSDNDARMIDVEASLGTQSLVNAAICAYMKAVGYNASAPRLIGCPAAFSSGTRIFIRFGDDWHWREGKEKDFIDGLNSFVEKALGPDPANPTVKTGGKTAALWKLAEDMRRQKEGKAGIITVVGGKLFSLGDSSPHYSPCCMGYGFELRFSGPVLGQDNGKAREKVRDTISEACRQCRPSCIGPGRVDLTFYEIWPEKDLVSIEILPNISCRRCEWPSESAAKETCDACLKKAMELFGAAMDVIEPSSGPKKPEAKQAVWGAGSGSLLEDAG